MSKLTHNDKIYLKKIAIWVFIANNLILFFLPRILATAWIVTTWGPDELAASIGSLLVSINVFCCCAIFSNKLSTETQEEDLDGK